MHISALQIHGFGPLSDFLLEGLTPGLNVVYGPNGSGKSTLLHFLRGLLLGYDESRQLGLLPPRDWTPTVRRQAGGSIALVDDAHKIGIVRTAGSDQQDHLGVRVQGGDVQVVQQYRNRLQQLGPEFVRLFLAVGARESHAVEQMLELIEKDGFRLQPDIVQPRDHEEQLADIRRRRNQLAGLDSDENDATGHTLARLDRQRRNMAERLEAARQSVIGRYRSLLDREEKSIAALATLTDEVEQLHLELQARQCDLGAAEDALWAQRSLQEPERRGNVEAETAGDLVSQHPRVFRARQMLLDLAEARHQYSCQIAHRLMEPESMHPSCDEMSLQELRRDRDQIDACEREVATYLQRLLERTQVPAGEDIDASDVPSDILPLAAESFREQIAAAVAAVERLREETSRAWNDYQAAIAKLCAAAETLRRVRCERQALAADDGLDVLRFQLQVIEQEWRQIHEEWQALLLAETALSRAGSLQRVETPSDLIAHASQLFRTLTQGRYRELRYVSGSGTLTAVNALSESLNLSLLSRGTLDQAALSLRLASLRAYAARGVCWPVVLDEVLVDSDLDRLRLTVAVMCELARESHQIIYLTCLEHLVEVMESAGANVLVMPGHRRQLRQDVAHPVSGPHWLATREQQSHPETPPSAVASTDSAGSTTTQNPDAQFYLELSSPIVDAPSIGPTTARKLARIGIQTVAEFMNRDPLVIAQRLDDRRISADTVLAWQQQAGLMLHVPGLRGHDAQILVACGIIDPVMLSHAEPEALFAKVGPFIATPEGQRLVRSARSPDLNEVSDWIDWARRARTLRAA
jgi:uncharacterized protein YhaN